jgi:hypothetical protein
MREKLIADLQLCRDVLGEWFWPSISDACGRIERAGGYILSRQRPMDVGRANDWYL